MNLRRLTIALPAILAPSLALAHTGVGDTSGFVHGLLHPLTGLDHVLAMLAAGLFAASLGGRALWMVPLSFLSVMALGGAAGAGGFAVPLVETGIALSVLVLGACLAFKIKPALSLAAGLVGVFAVFHGIAHGAEMPPHVPGAEYALGFLAATGLLHLAGIAMALAGARLSQRVIQLCGAAIALAGAALLSGAF